MAENPWIEAAAEYQAYAEYWCDQLLHGSREHAPQFTDLWERCEEMAEIARKAAQRWIG